ncbi:helicase-associated domain-containing protein [Kitasatospora sp. RB6PN24]|uniref:helicase C-terminal domain-containing protein n=1 Tax=Kitasatospora humi TaxID=2893891 RepID=UPI001E3A3023|nr:helicase-associated domain-containing protein [Kitasatospora humi]MCC9309492.1 helicase-associated domain-containing protein [Kitasatospora humi]
MFPISAKSGSTLATWLRGLDAPELARLLAARPDTASAPEPRSVGELADRLQRPASVALALPQLALPYLQVAEALVALGPAARDVLGSLLDAADGDRAGALDAVLGALADHGLVWPDGNGLLRMAAPLRQAWDAPLGLDAPLAQLLAGTTSDELGRMLAALGIKPSGNSKQQRLVALIEHHSDPARVTALVAKAPAAARNLLERQASRAPERSGFMLFGAPPSDSGPGERWALARGLLIRQRHLYGPARMPAEVALALRGPDWHAPFTPVPPVPRSVPVTAPDVEREAAAAAMAFAAHAASVVRACAATPPARLKAGGIGARELSRIGKAAQCDEIVLRLALETAGEAGLLARDGDRVAATSAYDTWAEEEPADQLAVLLRTWWRLPLTPGGSRDEDGKALPALAGTPPCGGCVQARHGLLTAASRLPAGEGAADPRDLGPLIVWHRPLVDELAQDATPFATLIREAELLGVLALGALSPIGAALLADDSRALVGACRQLLPAASGTARFGSDLTAVVTGTPSTALATLLDSVANRETSGAASVWRFSPGSVRRALDAGLTSEAIAADLAAVAVEPLPQPLSYLIHDTARSHGRVRVVSAACVIHGEEPALLAELAAHRKLTQLGLRQLAPTVLISRTAPDKTLAALRSAGYAPVAEKPDGSVRVERAERPRAATPVPSPRRPGGRSRSPQADVRTADARAAVDLSALAARLVAGPQDVPEPDPRDGRPYDSDTEEVIAGYARNLSSTDVRQLAHAVTAGQAITIEYVATSGSETVRTLSRLDLDPPYLRAWCHLRNDERVFTLSRIHGVMPA